MKNIYISIVALLTLTACNDSFMDKFPIEKQTELTAFQTYENFKTYSWGLYETFEDKDNYTRLTDKQYAGYGSDRQAGWLMNNSTTDANIYRTQNTPTPSGTDAGGWNFRFVRRVNLMLDNVDKSTMTQTDKDHWRSVGYFFRAYRYMELISRFGDVPWIDRVMQEDDEMKLLPRMPRKEVADKVLADLQFAEKNIKVGGDGKNSINTNVVRALISRFCLFEGTWRKYHKLNDSEVYLDECIRVSRLLAAAYPTVDPKFDGLLNTDDLGTYQGIILYKIYAPDLITNTATRYERSEMGVTEMPKSTVELYLSSNGKPITNASNTQYEGDKNMYNEFRNRDRRLMLSVVPPFCFDREMEKKGTNGVPTYAYPTKPIYNFSGYYKNPEVSDMMEYVNKIDEIRLKGLTTKRLPLFNWSCIRLAIYSPHLAGTGESQMFTYTGYYFWRQTNYWDNTTAGYVDRPLFWIEEVLLNLAEALYDRTGTLSQADADLTINKLRVRAGVAPMQVGEIDANFDPARDKGDSGVAGDYAVDPILWEIRRERIVETVGLGFGFYDIRRWKKGHYYINRDQIGAWFNKNHWIVLDKDKGTEKPRPATWNNFQVVDRNFNALTGEGYLKRYQNPKKEGKGWLDKYYLYPIPTSDLLFNPNLEQNDGWDRPTGK